MSPTLTHADLCQFTGDLTRYRHPLNPLVIYTPGVHYVAEAGKAYWLIDAVASYFGHEEMNRAIRDDARLASLQFWRLDVQGDAATLTARADSGETPFIRQEIPYTDFPLPSIDIWAGFDGVRWTLYLPSEH
jgi:hypothetical protein